MEETSSVSGRVGVRTEQLRTAAPPVCWIFGNFARQKWRLFSSLFSLVDCQQLQLFYFYCYFILLDPQGDAFQKLLVYVVLRFASSEDVTDLYLIQPLCKV